MALITSAPFIALSASFVSLLSGVATVFMYPQRSLGLVIPQASELFGVTGAASGVTIFLVFLGVIGFLIAWREARKNTYLLSLAIIPCALFFEHGQVVVAAYLAYFGSRAWEALAERNWHFEELQSITLLLIVCGILFTTLAVEKQRYTVDQDRADTVRFIVSAYPQGTSLYAHEDIAPILAYRGYYAKSDLVLPAGFVTTTLQKEGITLVVTRTEYPPVPNFLLLYQERENGYRIYEVPHE